jgi:hypothetical protein
VLIELEGERVDLALELTQAAGEPVALLAEGLGERHHRLDEPVLAVFGRQDVAHSVVLRHEVATGKQIGCRGRGPKNAYFGARVCRRPDGVTSGLRSPRGASVAHPSSSCVLESRAVCRFTSTNALIVGAASVCS